MEFHNSIIITQVQNGWLLQMPFHENPEILQVREQAREMAKALNRDELLDQLQIREEPKIKDIKTENIYLFNSIAELLKFVSEKLK